MAKRFRIVSWNVNGLRSVAKKGLLEWLPKSRADVIAMQETRTELEQLSPEVAKPKRWHLVLSSAKKKGYSGVGIYSRKKPDETWTSLGESRFDDEGRVLFARFGALTIASVYFPNGSGKDRDHGRVPYKLDFYKRVWEVLEEEKQKGGRILVMGDFNTALEEIDLARPKTNKKTSGFLDSERAELRRWIDSGWVDTFRHFDTRPDQYTWWSQRFGVRERNVGWRIDYVLASPGVMPFVESAKIHQDIMGSDHCPIRVELSHAALEE